MIFPPELVAGLVLCALMLGLAIGLAGAWWLRP